MSDKTKATGAKDGVGAKETGAEAVESASVPAWQAPDYTGPLDIEQAAWRRRNIKPVREAQTK